MINKEKQAKKTESETAIYEDMENFAPKMIFDETLKAYERSKPANTYTPSPSTLKVQGAANAATSKTSHRRCNVPMKTSEQLTNVGTHSLGRIPDKRCFQKDGEQTVQESDLEDHVYQELSDIQTAVYTKKEQQETNPSLCIYENTSAIQNSHRPCETKRSQSVGSLDATGWDGTTASNLLIWVSMGCCFPFFFNTTDRFIICYSAEKT